MTPTFDELRAAAGGDCDSAVEFGLRALDERRELEALPVLAHWQRDADVLHVAGLLYRGLGDLAAAIVSFEAALALKPNGPRLVHARARAGLEAGLDSIDWFSRARRLAPTDGDVILGHAAALIAMGRESEADAVLIEMLGQHPGWLPGHSACMELRHAAGRADWHGGLDAAIATAPRDPRLHGMKIMALNRAGNGEAALAALAAGIGAAGETLLLPVAAMVYTEHGRLDAADAAFAQLDPASDAGLAVNWLRHLLRRQRPADAAAFALALAPGLANAAQPYLSLAWRLLGDERGAQIDDDRFVRVIDLGPDWPVLAPLAEVLRGLHRARARPLDQSVRGGTQTDGPLFSRADPVIRQVRARVESEVAAYCAALPVGNSPFPKRKPQRPRFAGSWSVRLSGSGFHEPHIHGDGWLSSAFHIVVPEGLEDEAGALTIGEPQASLGLNLGPRRVIAAKPGRLILFPATTWHGTRPFAAGERLTVAFDIA